MKIRALLAVLLLAPLAALPASAPWPDRPIKIVVPQGAGSTAEAVARAVARQMQKAVGQPVLVENRPASSVKDAAPDGYTLLLATSDTLPTLPATHFAPISAIGGVPYALFVNAKLPLRTAQELVEYGRTTRLSYATTGAGEHLAASQFAKANGIEMTRVAYTSSPLADLAAGKVQVHVAQVGRALAESKKGRVRVLATLTNTRTPFTPAVPALGEEGLALPASSLTHHMLLAPAKTPADLVARLAREVQTAVGNRTVREELHKSYLIPRATSPGELANLIAAEQALQRP